MKRFYSLLVAALLVAAPLALTSCGDDAPDWWGYDWDWGQNYNNRPDDENVDEQDFWIAMAQTLAGQWRGDMRAYQLDDKGNAVDSIDYSTDIEFKQANSKAVYGTGTQWDYDVANKSDKPDFTREFNWNINTTNGEITLLYTKDNYAMTINYNDLNLNQRTFTGWLYATDGSEVDDFWFDRYTGNAKAAGPQKPKAKVTRVKVVMLNKQ